MYYFIFILGCSLIPIIYPYPAHADSAVPLPCTTILNAVDKTDRNAKGAALVYKVKLTPGFDK
ncbi:hypothetical protein P6P90_03120 [Ectobacillus antri]|jgi:hypothetical protein|uniref:Uncharacterized protein n=1 Tax=Ectobacillus antri TaxID=2486280 RepID=A0ABT6H2Y7_9BACI|nr:hypothetical protein [Ectobacillus antri]MDG4656315.1 hypothetical protein [Ectobacillus antri]MDG5752990.1 hypothetical protein [Ectobacillus antri]